MAVNIVRTYRHLQTIGDFNRLGTLPLYKLNNNVTDVHKQRCMSTRVQVPKYDMVIVGAGIVGMASAREISMQYPHLSLAVVEKEEKVAAHQSSNNSGVIHAGIYYTPGSMKATLCVEGLKLAYEYFEENNIPYKKCGKLIVATQKEEIPRLDALMVKGLKNRVEDLKLIGPEEIKEIEPHCVGLRAIHSPHTGIVDWGVVTESYAKNFEDLGGEIHLNYEVDEFKRSVTSDSYTNYPVTIKGKKEGQEIHCKYVITCGGLYSDKLAEKSGCPSVPKIVPFRGEYLLLKPKKRHLVNGNIYPVPDPRFPFLGVHFTPRINGDIWLGPNAVLAFKREGYKLSDIDLAELADSLAFRGLRKLVLGNLRYATGELYRGIRKSAQVKQLRRFIPELRNWDCKRGPSGVRAQALAPDGSLVDDFVFDAGTGKIGRNMLHVRNAPSPAATSSLAIAKVVAYNAAQQFNLKK